jgi:hypothetical protein
MGKRRSFDRLGACKGAATLLAWAVVAGAPAQASDSSFGLMAAEGHIGQSFSDAQQFIAQNRFSAMNWDTENHLNLKSGAYPITYSDEVAARLGLGRGMNLMNLPSLMGNSLGVNFGAGGEPGMRGPTLNLMWHFGQ